MIINSDTGAVLAHGLKKADTFWSRFLGLMPYKHLPKGEGLLISPCQSVHTFFMHFAIDVLYLDSDRCVLAIFPSVKPWRVLPLKLRCRYVLEVPPGTLRSSHTDVGHCLKITA
jgi:uncharacterized membrane protein (UPF0127 family)